MPVQHCRLGTRTPWPLGMYVISIAHHLVGPAHLKPTQQVRIHRMAGASPAGVGLPAQVTHLKALEEALEAAWPPQAVLSAVATGRVREGALKHQNIQKATASII